MATTKKKVGRPKKNENEKAKAIIRPVSFKQEEQWILDAFEKKSYKPFSFSYMVKRLIIDYVEGRVSIPYEPYIPDIPLEDETPRLLQEQPKEENYTFTKDEDVSELEL